MIDKLTSFFSHQKQKSVQFIPLFFTEDENVSISIEISPEKTISQIYIENINQISVIIAKISQKKNLSQNLDYCFTLYSPKDPFIRIKQSFNSNIWKILILKNLIEEYSLFYSINENYYLNNKKHCIIQRLNNLTNNKRKFEENLDKQFSDETYIINFVSPINKLMEGEIEKFSFSQKIFKKINIYIDSNKLMYKESSQKNKSESFQNLWNVIPLANISKVNINSLDDIEIDSPYIDINKYKDRIFTVKTFNDENILFKTNDKTDKEVWFNALKKVVEQVRSDKMFFKFKKEADEYVKKIYINLLKFIYKLIGIKGTICFQNSRKFLLNNIKNYYMEKVVQCCVEYKLNMHKKNYNKALEEINKLRNILEIDVRDNDETMRKIIIYIEDIERDKIMELINDETYSKIINILKYLDNNKKSSPIIPEPNLLDNLLQNITNKYLIKEHKKILHKNKIDFLNNLSKIAAAQFCKKNYFNCNKMFVFCKENMDINIPSSDEEEVSGSSFFSD